MGVRTCDERGFIANSDQGQPVHGAHGLTRPAQVAIIDAPELWPRDPPVRYRKTVADSWLRLTITEGRNRQARRMTAAVEHPTLRLMRWSIGSWVMDGLQPGQGQAI